MPLASVGFLVGVLFCQSLTELPMREWSFLILILIPLGIRFPNYRFIIFLLLGFLYSVFIAHSKLEHKISSELEGKELLVTGTVLEVSSKTDRRIRFLFNVSDLSEFGKSQQSNDNFVEYSASDNVIPRRIQLSWYNNAPDISLGQRWQFKVKLKRPRGFSNPGGFDYEGWLYQHDIDATGYVRSGKNNGQWNKRLAAEPLPLTNLFQVNLQQLRQTLSQKISMVPGDQAHASLINALVVGDRSSMTDEQWSTLTGTGTNHLMAISGLHIGLVAGLIFYLSSSIWRRIPNASLYVAAPRIAALCSILAALVYAALAGFTLPTQRALIMICVAMIAVWVRRPLVSSTVLSSALFVVLLYDPTAVMSGSFWLSFLAVAVIVYSMSNRVASPSGLQKIWWQWGRLQWVIAVGLAPVLLFWFQQVPLVSPAANFIAVPVVSLITVPFSLAGTFFLLTVPALGELLLSLAHFSLELLWPLLEAVAGIEFLLFTSSKPPLWTLLSAAIGTLLLLAPKGFPTRWLGMVWILPLLFYPRAEIPYGTYRFTQLDVGHGLASVVQTQKHVMVYDVGPRYSENFNAGEAVVVPFLKYQGINRIDQLILSHDDIDHTGGFEAVIRQVPVKHVLLSPGMTKNHPESSVCERGNQWTWDGVQFTILHPGVNNVGQSDNNKSCVVQISTENDKLLLTGDIERLVETQFIKYFASDDDDLRADFSADVLVVPHHGSASSSSEAFVQTLSPDYALISAGYMNRYGLPKANVVHRYEAINATVLNTARHGAISFFMGKEGLSELSLHRNKARRFWNN